jgi:hypothetical protein
MIQPGNTRSISVARLGMTPRRDDVLLDIPVVVHAVDRGEWAARGRFGS